VLLTKIRPLGDGAKSIVSLIVWELNYLDWEARSWKRTQREVNAARTWQIERTSLFAL
jgi:hypothetical protein